ncbi:MAG: LysR substrate-binding domain-containing protein [Roseovarius sp.]
MPTTGALFAFESVARKRSFSEASREFNVTQPAISKTIKQLEEQLGVTLFHRSSNGVELTPQGRILADAVSGGFRQIEAALDEIERMRESPTSVTISVTSAFALHWFMPRLDRYKMALPDIPIRFQIMHGEPVGPLEGADLGVRHDNEETQGFDRWFLQKEVVIPVASPGYVAAHGTLDHCSSLKGHTLGHLNEPLRLPWRKYLSEMGYPPPVDASEMLFSDYALLLQAVIKGQCIGLGWRYVIAHELEQKGLVAAASKHYKTGLNYYIVTPSNRPIRPEATRVRDWLLAEVTVDN